MASRKDLCRGALKAHLPDAKAAEINEILDEVESLQSKFFGETPTPHDPKFAQYAMEYLDGIRAQKAKEAHIKVMGELTHERNTQFLGQYEKRPWYGVSSILERSRAGRFVGNRNAIETNIRSKFNLISNGLHLKIREHNLETIAEAGTHDREAARAVRGETNGVSTEGKLYGDIIGATNKALLKMKKAAGIPIGEILGYIAKQTHDIMKLTEAGKEAWVEFTHGRLDPEKTFGRVTDITTQKKMLGDIYDQIRTQRDSVEVFGNLAERHAQARALHFKTADDFMDYFERFAEVKTLKEAVEKSLYSGARDVAFVERLGPNPQRAFDRLIRETEKKITDPEIQARFRDEKRNMQSSFENTWRTFDRPPTNLIGHAGKHLLEFETLSSLGSSALAQVGDTFVASFAAARFNGKPVLQNYIETILDAVPTGIGKAERSKWLAEAGAAVEDVLGEALHRMGATTMEKPGAIAGFLRRFGKHSLLEPITAGGRAVAAKRFLTDLGEASTKGWEALSENQRAFFQRYDIHAPDWELIRSGAEEFSGKQIVSHATLDRLPVTKFVTEEAKTQLIGKFQVMVTDQINQAILHSSDRTRLALRGDTSINTPWGVARRLLTQFKGYAMESGFQFADIAMDAPGVQTWGDVPKSLLEGKGANRMLGKYVLGMTAMGYVSIALKEMAKGNEPPDPSSPETIRDAMSRGGAFGIVGDIFLHDYSKIGVANTGPLEVAAGPAAGDVAELLKMGRVVNLGGMSEKERRQYYRESLKFLTNKVPYQNLFYTQWAYDQLFRQTLLEAVDPGYRQRRERNFENRTGREMFTLDEATGGSDQ